MSDETIPGRQQQLPPASDGSGSSAGTSNVDASQSSNRSKKVAWDHLCRVLSLSDQHKRALIDEGVDSPEELYLYFSLSWNWDTVYTDAVRLIDDLFPGTFNGAQKNILFMAWLWLDLQSDELRRGNEYSSDLFVSKFDVNFRRQVVAARSKKRTSEDDGDAKKGKRQVVLRRPSFDFQSMAVPVDKVSLPEYSEDPTKMPDFIALEGWLDQLCEWTIMNTDSKDMEHPKVIPTALTRISRGGKSRTLQELALAISNKSSRTSSDSSGTNNAYPIIKISFNTDTPVEEWEQQDPLAALCLRIAFAARKDTDVIFERFRSMVQVDQRSVEEWLGDSTCILMVDELNRLHQNIFVAEFLKKNFLVLAGRGLVFTSHVVTLNSTLSDYMDSTGNRPIVSFKLPDIVSLTDTRTKLGGGSSTLSPQHILYLGKIPALIQSYLTGTVAGGRRENIVRGWRDSIAFNRYTVERLLSSMITGRVYDVPECLLEFMDIDVEEVEKQNVVRWVPYHMKYIMATIAEKGYTSLSDDMAGCLQAIAKLFDTFRDAKTESGDSWEALFLIVLLVRCLSRQFDDTILPLAGFSDETTVRYNVPYSGNHFHSKYPLQFVGGIPGSGLRSSISLYWPGHARFEHYDIIVAVWDADGERSLYGYQCKEGSKLPSSFANEGLFEWSYVIRGIAVERDQSVRRWTVPSDSKLQSFFGVSSSHWSPQAWKALKNSGDAAEVSSN